ncbi:Cupin domain-containing protein [Cladophialophora immunda]|nr:Cupin domain-containing protein [Cladophialophora immunda]
MLTNGNNAQVSPLPSSTIHITTHNASGQATLHSSERAQWMAFKELKYASALLYTTTAMPTNLNDDADIKRHQEVASRGRVPAVLPKGTVCRFVDFEPNSKGFMHRTQSLDYGIVMEGEVVLELDDGSETHMTRGDVAIQRGTIHAWSNPNPTEWARVLFVLQDCQPLLVNGKRFKEDLGAANGHVPESANDIE